MKAKVPDLSPQSWKPVGPHTTPTKPEDPERTGGSRREKVAYRSVALLVLSISDRAVPRGSSSTHRLSGPESSATPEGSLALVPAQSRAYISGPSDHLSRKN